MSCTVCSDLKAEISGQRAFFAQWSESFREQIQSILDSKFRDSEQKSLEFRKEILHIVNGIRSDGVTINAQKSSCNTTFQSARPADAEDESSRNLLEFGLNQSAQTVSPGLTNNQSDYQIVGISDAFSIESPTESRSSCASSNTMSISGISNDKISSAPVSQFNVSQMIENAGAPSFQNGSSASGFAEVKLELEEEMNGLEMPAMLTSWVTGSATLPSNDTPDVSGAPKTNSAKCSSRKRKNGMVRRYSPESFLRPSCSAKQKSQNICCLCGVGVVGTCKYSYESHTQVHIDRKPFQCSDCGLQFKQRCNAYRHAHQMHSSTKSAKDLIVWAFDEEDYKKTLAAKMEQCFPAAASTMLLRVNSEVNPESGKKVSVLEPSTAKPCSDQRIRRRAGTKKLKVFEEINEDEEPLSSLVNPNSIASKTVATPSQATELEQSLAICSTRKKGLKKKLGPRISANQLKQSQKWKSRSKKLSNRTILPMLLKAKKLSCGVYRGNGYESSRAACRLCGKVIISSKNEKFLKRKHAVVHLEENAAFQCSECCSKFTRFSNGVRHAQKVHSGAESAKGLIVWVLDKEEYHKNLAAKTAECFPIHNVSNRAKNIETEVSEVTAKVSFQSKKKISVQNARGASSVKHSLKVKKSQ